MIAWCNIIAISSLAVTHCKSTSLVCVDLPLSLSPCPLQSFAGSVSFPIRLPLFQWRRKILAVRGAVSVAARIAREGFLTTPTFRKDHAHLEYSMLLGHLWLNIGVIGVFILSRNRFCTVTWL